MVLNENCILKQFSLVTYPIEFVLAIGDVEEEVNKLYAPNTPEANWIGIPLEGTAGSTYMIHTKADNQLCVMIWFPKFEEIKGYWICHESGHAALELFREIGAVIDPKGDQECFCYLLQTFYRLSAGCYEELKNYRKENLYESK